MKKKRLKKLQCCERCQNYWTCETKWYRGENNKDNICCSLCIFYGSCWDGVPVKAARKPR